MKCLLDDDRGAHKGAGTVPLLYFCRYLYLTLAVW